MSSEHKSGTAGTFLDRLPGVSAAVSGVKAVLYRTVMRNDHYDLWSEAGEAVRDGALPAWEKYPRPQMKRDSFFLLKDGWTLDQQSIRMPFPPQAMLSGYKGKVGSHLLYETEFVLPENFRKERILLHFGAVDQIAEVFVNDHLVGKHEGGYLPFSFDITDKIRDGQVNHLTVKVTDELDKAYPYGKQTKKRGGMWYTPVSGIWQSVWLESVPEVYIKKIKMEPDLEGVQIDLDCDCKSFDVVVMLEDGKRICRHFDGSRGRLEIAGAKASDGSSVLPKYWTPDNPYLYTMKILAGKDEVETYFALRTISLEKRNGISRVCLNGEPVFLHGILDQGYYSDGLYLPAREEEFEQDILRMKNLGYNLLRKHIKVEPEYFYYACDKLGMLVMQDMVNNGSYSFLFDTALPTLGLKTRKDKRIFKNRRCQQIFREHTKETIEHLYNHPSIVAYTVFNEGWGQFCSDEMYDYVKNLDPSRLVDATSGWFAQKKNDFDSEHIYFKIIDLKVKERPLFISECGGYSMAVNGHYYSKHNQYGYGTCEDARQLTEEIEKMYREMILPSVPDGVCGCVYTQLSDVEDEINGLYTYDRRVCKVLLEKMCAFAEELQQAVKTSDKKDK